MSYRRCVDCLEVVPRPNTLAHELNGKEMVTMRTGERVVRLTMSATWLTLAPDRLWGWHEFCSGRIGALEKPTTYVADY
jgi:hypothetical protein